MRSFFFLPLLLCFRRHFAPNHPISIETGALPSPDLRHFHVLFLLSLIDHDNINFMSTVCIIRHQILSSYQRCAIGFDATALVL